MKSRVVVAVSATALILAACGGGGGKQDEVADMVLDEMEGEDVEVDEDCVRDAANKLSDDDAQKILDAGPDGQADDLSDDAMDAGASLFECFDFDSILDEIDTSIPDLSIPDLSIPDVSMPDVSDFLAGLDMEGLDEECFQDVLDGIDMSSADIQELTSAALGCISVGG